MREIQSILPVIDHADSSDLSKLVQAIIARYQVLFPDEEVVFLSLPIRDREERAAVLRRALELLEHP